jgi:hypothetical protein
LKFPDDVRKELQRRFKNRHKEWLEVAADIDQVEGADWPLAVNLGIPSENQALKQVEDVRAWVTAWQSWHGKGELTWKERRWRILGTQKVPAKLVLHDPAEVAQCVGEGERWGRATHRHGELTERWPRLTGQLKRHFNVLADYSEADYQRLINMVGWLEKNPDSDFYPRQVPVAGLDSKWLENRQAVIFDLVDAIRDQGGNNGDFFEICGLKRLPNLIRLRLLDEGLRSRFGGLSDISPPLEQLASLDIQVSCIFIVENLQTGLAFDDLPGSMVIMGLGYQVGVLAKLPWVSRARCIYWGDLDTHGFAILSRARSHLPNLQSLLMDEATLFSHRELWVDEKSQSSAAFFPLLTDAEQSVYQGLKNNAWGQNVRLEQERIAWDVAWKTLKASI